MIDDWYLQTLRCPKDSTPLHWRAESNLHCDNGHTFPIVDGVPVMLVEEAEPTLHVLKGSIKASKRGAASDDPLFLSTVGVDEEQRKSILSNIETGKDLVDPVVNYLVGHTNGIMYKHLIGRLRNLSDSRYRSATQRCDIVPGYWVQLGAVVCRCGAQGLLTRRNRSIAGSRARCESRCEGVGHSGTVGSG